MSTNNFEEQIKDIIVELCEVMYRYGYRQISLGAIMRMVGVPEDVASSHDTDVFKLDHEFEQLLEFKKISKNLPDHLASKILH